MCESIIYKDKVIECYREAREAFGADALVWDEDCNPARSEDECLCHLDMEATAKRLGLTADNQHGGDPFEWHFR